MKTIYTESALHELENFNHRINNDLENIIKDKKYVFGDDTLEITASDIREAENHFEIRKSNKSLKTLTIRLLLKFYLFIGISMITFGIFYEELRAILIDPTRAMYIISGCLLVFLYWFGLNYIKLREKTE